jgi:hypothetical protein
MVGSDSTFYKGDYATRLRALVAKLSETYDVKTLRFGAHVDNGIDTLNYDEKLTDFSGLLNDIYDRYSGRNLGAVVIASDGLYNKGSNPVYAYQKLNVPVFTVALGDTTVHKDVLVSNVMVNRLAYLGNNFPMQITVEGRKAAGASATLTVTRKGNVYHTEQIAFTDEHFFKTINLTLDANEIGLQKYTIQLTPVDNEITLVNNRKDVFIDVLDNREKILILAAAPHPDLAAIREAISSNESYKVETKLAKDFSGNTKEYSMIVYHQLPAMGNLGLNTIKDAMSKNVPGLFVWGSATDFRSFNDLNLGYALKDYRSNSSDIGGYFAEGFPHFNIDEGAKKIIRTLPPLNVPFGDYSFSPGASAVVFEQLGQLQTKKPLISFNHVGENKIGLIVGEGLWRWRLNCYQQTQSHATFDELLTKTVQYLSSKEDRSLFRVNGDNDFPENEPILFNAELYNEAYEPINNRDVRMKIRNEEGREFEYTFSPNGAGYRLDAGTLPVGNYSYEATAQGDAKVLIEKGEFSVSAIQLETVNTVADHRMLYQFAKNNNGEMVYPNALESLEEKIKNTKEIVSISYENKHLDDLINFKWLLALIILLLGTEWLLRKRAGTY